MQGNRCSLNRISSAGWYNSNWFCEQRQMFGPLTMVINPVTSLVLHPLGFKWVPKASIKLWSFVYLTWPYVNTHTCMFITSVYKIYKSTLILYTCWYVMWSLSCVNRKIYIYRLFVHPFVCHFLGVATHHGNNIIEALSTMATTIF